MTTAVKARQRRYRLDVTWPALLLMAASAVLAWQTPGPAGWDAGGMRGDVARVVGSGSNPGPTRVDSRRPGMCRPRWRAAPASPVVPLDGRQLYQRMFHAAAWVRAKDPVKPQWSTGSAWLVDRSERLLVTNHHVISWGHIYVLPDRFLQVYFPESRDGALITDPNVLVREGRGYRVRVVDDDPLRDLALLRVEEQPGGQGLFPLRTLRFRTEPWELPSDREPLPLAREGCQPGETIHSIGNPLGGQVLWVYSSGTVRQVFHRAPKIGGVPIWRYRCVETQSPVNPGDSGGPVVNGNGEVVAVNSGRAYAMFAPTRRRATPSM